MKTSRNIQMHTFIFKVKKHPSLAHVYACWYKPADVLKDLTWLTKKAYALDICAAAQMLTCSHTFGVTNSSAAASTECVKGLFIAVWLQLSGVTSESLLRAAESFAALSLQLLRFSLFLLSVLLPLYSSCFTPLLSALLICNLSMCCSIYVSVSLLFSSCESDSSAWLCS